VTRAVHASPALSRSQPTVGGYLYDSELPLTSLVFVIPLMVIYEVGTRFLTTAAHRGYQEQIIAFNLTQRLCELLGVHAQHVPPLVVAVILLAWHAARKARWQVHAGTVVCMCFESAALALPLILLSREVARYFPLAAIHGQTRDSIIMALGAGVYEELVFRLILFTSLSIIFREPLRQHPFAGGLGIVLISAFAFSGYHYLSPIEHFTWRVFLFRSIAGAYFGALFLLRGFGITAGCHAAYDLLILAL
jgi:CAAX prenyl protease-like protein